jgi:PilZ domain
VSEPSPGATRRLRLMRCWRCGREQAAAPSEIRKFTVAGFPRCCRAAMSLVAGPPAPPLPAHPNRLGRRWLARRGARAEVRRSQSSPGPDLGAGLVDLSLDGACVRLTAPLEVGDAVWVRLRRRGAPKGVEMPAEVRWCKPEGGGVFLAGLRLERPLTDHELAGLAQ